MSQLKAAQQFDKDASSLFLNDLVLDHMQSLVEKAALQSATKFDTNIEMLTRILAHEENAISASAEKLTTKAGLVNHVTEIAERAIAASADIFDTQLSELQKEQEKEMYKTETTKAVSAMRMFTAVKTTPARAYDKNALTQANQGFSEANPIDLKS